MSEVFDDSVETSSFDDVSTDTTDTSSFSDTVDVSGLMDDISTEQLESFDVEPLDSSFDAELSTAEAADIDSLMDNAADTYTTEDVPFDALDSSVLDPSDISNATDDYEMDAGSDISYLMDEEATESLEGITEAAVEGNDSTGNDIETLMNDVEPVPDISENPFEIGTDTLENSNDNDVEALLEEEEIPQNEVPDFVDGFDFDNTEKTPEEISVSTLMDEGDIDNDNPLVDESSEYTSDGFEAEDVIPTETDMGNEVDTVVIPEADPLDDMSVDDPESNADIIGIQEDEQGEAVDVLYEEADAQPDSPLEAEVSAYNQLADYYNSHNYGQQDYAEYSKDPEWQELNNAYLQELGRDPIDYSGGETSDITDIRDELIAAGIPENSPELDAIMANEQAGIDAIVEVQQSSSPPIDPIDDGASNSPTESLDTVGASNEPVHLTQSETEEFIENSSDKEALQNLRDGIESGDIKIDVDDAAEESDTGPVLTREESELWESGNRAIDENIEAMRDDLRDKGLEDGPEMESIVMAQRARMQEELERNIHGDFSDPYQKPDFEEILQERQTEEIAEPGQDFPQDLSEETPSVTDLPNEINYDEVFEGLDDYDFDGISYAADLGRLDSSLDNFDSSTWEGLTLDEQKAAMTDLADYVKDVIGFDNPPEIVYYNNPVDGDYGGYSPESNTLEVNEYMLYNNEEAADTVAHELWHAYQHQRANNPQSAKDYQYQYGFDNYIRPEDDFAGYQDQLVEAEARAFAQQFKDRLNIKGRRI